MHTLGKRNDIQWLRAIAILQVLFFHTWLKTFFYGYLGVDIFFVISGYLMTSILARNQTQSIWTFYSRRIKRIFPLFMLIIACSLIIGLFTLLPTYFMFLQTEALWSIFFINNFSTMLNQQKYFELVSDFKFFLHTWSLAIEIQFYLMAPLLINFIFARKNSLSCAAVFAFASAALQLNVPNESVAFELVFCRIWQFLVGTISYIWIQQQQSNANQIRINEASEISALKNSSWNSNVAKAALSILILIGFLPFDLPTIIAPILRLIITSLTGIFIVFNSQSSSMITLPPLFNKILVYIGNASYSIYLVHWPVIVFFKYFNIFDNQGQFFALICVFLLSLFIHECFEKLMSKLSLKHNLLFVGTCFCIILYLSLHNMPLLLLPNTQLKPYIAKEVSDAIKLNEAEAISCFSQNFFLRECKTDSHIEKYLKNRPDKHVLDAYCSYQQNTTSKKTILITGNSYIWFQIYGISEAIKRSKTQFSKVFVVSHPGCSILFGELNNHVKRWGCENFDGSHDELIKVIKPDIIIHSSRFDHFFTNQTFPHNKVKYNESNLSSAVLKIASLTKKLIILQPPPHFLHLPRSGPLTVANLLLINQSLENFKISTQEFEISINFSWKIFQKAIKNCTNCVTINTQKRLCDDKICEYLNPKSNVVRYCDGSHMTPNQSLQLIPDLIKAIDFTK